MKVQRTESRGRSAGARRRHARLGKKSGGRSLGGRDPKKNTNGMRKREKISRNQVHRV